jgi:hypothetical protein
VGDFFSKFTSSELIALVAVGGGLLLAIISTIVGQWRRVRLAEFDASLKQQMLEKGMSPAEIEQVIKATSRRQCESQAEASSPATQKFTGVSAADKAILIQLMSEEGYEGEDIERVLHAFAQGTPMQEQAAKEEKAVAVANMVKNHMEAEGIERVLLAFDGERQHAPHK